MGSIVTAATATRRVALVRIDSREAVIVRWTGGEPAIVRLASDVPAHGRATRHVRYDPLTRHGGGGSEQAAEERRRIEHLDRFVDQVIGRLADDEDLVLVGHGTVHERLEARIRELDRRARRARSVEVRRADQPTERQLVAELREHLGAAARRRHVGG